MGGSSGWPALPELDEAAPAQARRAWGKVPHEERFRRQRRQLLAAAAKLASRHGYHATRLQDIVTEAGLSKSTFYEHFASKEDCFVELYRHVSAAMLRAGIDAAEETLAQGPYVTVLAVIQAMTGYVSQNPRLAEVLGEEVSASHPLVAQERDDNQKRLAELFTTLARRLDSPLSNEELRLSAMVLVQGMIAVIRELRRKGTRFDARLEAMARLACRGMALGDR
jgi:AcrR family transcriptional regulator